ncbi:MAG: YcjX family protein, partial [Pseudolabrys sp.]
MSGKSMFDRAGTNLSEFFSGAFDLTELARGSTINLAVTGLSRAGKTVFITSLVHNLLSALHQPYRMPFLKVVVDGRLVGARLASDKTNHLPQFPYKRNIEQMAANPASWPARTTEISEIEVDIRFTPTGALGVLLGWIGSGVATLKLKIIDYPGEWLLDLPLLDQSYAQWSYTTLQLCRRGIRAETARDFIAFLSDHRHDASASEEDARRAYELYRQHLLAARDQHGLNFLQPGRFLDPGSLGENSYMWFAPLYIPDDLQRSTDGTLAALMERRFEAYKTEVVMPFYSE